MEFYPMSRILKLVNATSKHETVNFMDVDSGYNQIRMHPDK